MKFCATFPFFFPDVTRPYGEVIDQCLEIAVKAEDLGFDSIMLPEHHFINYITNPSDLIFAARIAGATKRIRIITGVLVLPYHHPLALAEEIALVDWMTNGRLEIGVARGANKYEFDRLGIDWNQNRAMYNESLEILVKAWTTEDFSYHGKFWSFDSTTTLPRPYQQPYPPLWISGQSLDGVRAIAARGANLLTSPNYGCFAPHGDVDVTLGEFQKALAEYGQPKPNIGLLRRVFVDETRKNAERYVESCFHHWNYYMAFFESNQKKRFQERTYSEAAVHGGAMTPAQLNIDLSNVYDTYDDPIITDPAGAIKRIKHYESLGVTHLMMLTAFGIPHGEVLRSMELIAREVMPHFREESATSEVRAPALAGVGAD